MPPAEGIPIGRRNGLRAGDTEAMKRRLPVVAAGCWLLLLTFSSVAFAKVYPGWVIPEVLRVRSGPGEDRPVIGTVTRGDKLTVTAFVDGWCYAKLPDGRRGYVMEKYVQFSRRRAGSSRPRPGAARRVRPAPRAAAPHGSRWTRPTSAPDREPTIPAMGCARGARRSTWSAAAAIGRRSRPPAATAGSCQTF
ncbi:MAG: SH3 domain-containing protein [Armatimonadetes bacterium]|nr:SH3 domain-containing protein [Armatimonadota bacterium]